MGDHALVGINIPNFGPRFGVSCAIDPKTVYGSREIDPTSFLGATMWDGQNHAKLLKNDGFVIFLVI